MYEADIDALTAKEQLGHADIQTTLSIYTHLSNQKKENDIKKLDAFLKKGSQGVVSAVAQTQ
jgi:integrase